MSLRCLVLGLPLFLFALTSVACIRPDEPRPAGAVPKEAAAVCRLSDEEDCSVKDYAIEEEDAGDAQEESVSQDCPEGFAMCVPG